MNFFNLRTLLERLCKQASKQPHHLIHLVPDQRLHSCGLLGVLHKLHHAEVLAEVICCKNSAHILEGTDDRQIIQESG